MPRIALVSLITAVALSAAIDDAAADPIAPGDNELTADLGHTRMTVFTHRPKCEEPSLLLVFHGLGRNAEAYRNRARRLGDRPCDRIDDLALSGGRGFTARRRAGRGRGGDRLRGCCPGPFVLVATSYPRPRGSRPAGHQREG